MQAETIVGPMEGAILDCVGRLPSGAPLDMCVLLLGEGHVVPAEQPGVTAQQLIALAGQTGRCVDVYVETPVSGRSRAHAGDRTLARLNQWLLPCLTHQAGCDLDAAHVRVHAFDTRVRRADWRQGGAVPADAGTPFPGGWTTGVQYAYFSYLSGLGPRPDGFAEHLRDSYLNGSGPDTERWLARHDELAARVRRRTRRMPRADVCAVLMAAYVAVRHCDWGNLMAQASDVYLLLRMIAPYDDRPQRPANGCGQPRSCLVYAGAAHTRHIARALTRLCHGRDKRPPTPNDPLPRHPRDALAIREIAIVDSRNRRVGPVGDVAGLLARLGLLTMTGGATPPLHTPFDLPTAPRGRRRPALDPDMPPLAL